jgi:hypothetical protein
MKSVGEKMPRLVAERHAQRVSLLERSGVSVLGSQNYHQSKSRKPVS